MINHYNSNVAVIIPCFNEEAAIYHTVSQFIAELPDARVYVFDNNSTDSTIQKATEAGAIVVSVKNRGKGNVVRRMFADIDADIYLMADGDCTYDAKSAPIMIKKLIDEKLDMVVGCRIDKGEKENYRRGHRFGNLMLTGAVQKIFGGAFTDMLSGYRVFSKRYVKSFPAISSGFEIETELTIHALELRMPYGEVLTQYNSRPEGSMSKLSTYKDGLKILRTIIKLYVIERPLSFFTYISLILTIIATVLMYPIAIEFLHTGFVRRFPTAILCVGIIISALLSGSCGLILNTVTIGRHELKRLFYLSIPLTIRDVNKK